MGHLIHGQVVVGDGAALLLNEIAAIARCGCGTPNTVNDRIGVFYGIVFAIEAGLLSAHHVEQDAEACLVVGLVRIACPVLRAETP